MSHPSNQPSATTLSRDRALKRVAQYYCATRWTLVFASCFALSYLGLSYLTAHIAANESVAWLGTHTPVDPMHAWFVTALALLASVQALALRRPLHDLSHEQLLCDITNLTPPLIARTLEEKYRDIAPAFRASRIAENVQAECGDIGHQVSELLALLSTIGAQELQPYERELRTVRSLLPAAQTKAEQMQTYLDHLQGEITELEDELRALKTTEAGQTAKTDRLYQRVLDVRLELETRFSDSSSVVTNLPIPSSK